MKVRTYPRSRTTRAALTALAVLAGWASLRLASPGGQPPVAPSRSPALVVPTPRTLPIDDSGQFRCPAAAPVAAYARSRLFYPTNYPRPPADGVPPAACFRTEVDALTAGFEWPPSPPGVLEEEEVYLAAGSSALTKACPAAARILRFAVPCPTLLPLPSPGGALSACGPPPPESTNPGCVDPYGESLFLFWSPGDGVALSDVVVEAFPTSRPQDPLSDGYCERGPVLGTAAVGRDVGTFVFCQPNPTAILGGHVMLTWRHGRVTYQVALAPDSYAARRATLDIARFIRYVRG